MYEITEKDGREYISVPAIEMNEDGTIDGKRLIKLLRIDLENYPTALDMVMGEIE